MSAQVTTPPSSFLYEINRGQIPINFPVGLERLRHRPVESNRGAMPHASHAYFSCGHRAALGALVAADAFHAEMRAGQLQGQRWKNLGANRVQFGALDGHAAFRNHRLKPESA